jgi:RNA polymerase sigma factor (sigma-70 family)
VNLDDWVSGNFEDLRRRARWLLTKERRKHTFQSGDLVNQVWLGTQGDDVDNPMAYMTVAMFRCLMQHARNRSRTPIGHLNEGDPEQMELSISKLFRPGSGDLEQIDDLYEALANLEKIAPRQARAVELHFLLEMSLDDTAEILGVSRATAKRDILNGKTHLRRLLRPSDTEGEAAK